MRAVALLLLVPNLAFAQPTLAWKFKPGDVFVYERVAKDEQSAAVKGQAVKQDVRSTFVYRFEVQKAATESATLQATFEQVQVQHAATAGQIDNRLLEKLKGATLTLTVTPRGEITGMTGYDKLIEQVADKKKGLADTARQLWPESLVRFELQQLLTLLPSQPTIEGGRWQREESMPAPPLGKFATTLTIADRGPDRAGHRKFAGTLTGKYERPEQPADLFRVAGGQLALEKGQWSCTFDPDRGRVVNQNFSFELRGELTVELVGMPTPVEMTIKRDVATKLVPRD